MFPDLSVEMIEVGESTGALPAMLNSVAEFYEEDVQTALAIAASSSICIISSCITICSRRFRWT
jgi:type II secretory pathway component PulF